jgi:hypothetical protein
MGIYNNRQKKHSSKSTAAKAQQNTQGGLMKMPVAKITVHLMAYTAGAGASAQVKTKSCMQLACLTVTCMPQVSSAVLCFPPKQHSSTAKVTLHSIN